MADPERTEANERLEQLASKLTPSQKQLLAGKLAGLSGVQSVRAGEFVGNVETIAKYASEGILRPRSTEVFREVQEEAGITGRKLVETLQDGLAAMSYEVTRDGRVVETGPDWLARWRITETLLKVRGAYPDKKVEVVGDAQRPIIVRHTPDLEL